MILLLSFVRYFEVSFAEISLLTENVSVYSVTLYFDIVLSKCFPLIVVLVKHYIKFPMSVIDTSF